MSTLTNLLKIGAGITLLAGLRNIPHLLRGTNASSWADVTKALRVEPVTVVDERCINLPYLRDVLYTATATTAAYYLQAAAVQGSVGKLDVVRVLDGLNPKRDTVSNVGFLIGDVASGVSMMSAPAKLPVYNTDPLQERINLESMRAIQAASLEAKNNQQQPPTPAEIEAAALKGRTNLTAGRLAEAIVNTSMPVGTRMSEAVDVVDQIHGDAAVNIDRDALKSATDIANLSVGALISVEISDGKEKRKVPVTVRLIVSGIRTNILSSIFKEAAHNREFKERYHAWRAGQIEFIKDMVLCQDIIDQDIKNRIEDKSGTWREMKARQTSNRFNTLLSLGTRPSIATASNVYVMSKETLIECEQAMGGRISNLATRKRLFDNTMMMLLYVIDTKREIVEVWHRGQATSTIQSIKEMQLNGKEKSATIELNEAFKAYTGTGF